MSAAKGPRQADVERWAEQASQAVPPHYGGAARREVIRERDHARGMLSSWGLGYDGKPKAAPEQVA